MQGIIVENISNLYKIKSGNQIYESTARGKLKQEEITPLVGDRVEFEVIDAVKQVAVINQIMPRKMYIKRPRMANISQLIIVISMKKPSPDLLMLDKQLAYCEYLKIKPIIVLNKIDLKDNYKEIQDIYQKIGYTVILTVAKEGIGIDKIKNELNGNISAFSGNSGVGKSTIINALFAQDITKIGDISKKNLKGKNTTTSVKLYVINENTFIADTPGFANFDITEIESKNLEKYFIEFNPYIEKCEFVGCTHIKEQNCGIKQAVKNGDISQERYDKFCKIYLELKEKEERRW